MKNKDNRIECFSEKKIKIKESLAKTRLKRSNQIVKVFECKIVEKRLGLFGKQVQHSCMGLVKEKLKWLPKTIVLDKWIPTTKLCPKCHAKHNMSLDKRTYICECGYSEDRDIHSSKNMVEIKNLVFSKLNFVPTEHREITLMEFKTSVNSAGSIVDKSEL